MSICLLVLVVYCLFCFCGNRHTPQLTPCFSSAASEVWKKQRGLRPTGRQPAAMDRAERLQAGGLRPHSIPAGSAAASAWQSSAGDLLLHGPGLFSRWAPWATVALACAGTATEQCVGLGIPALSLPGPGPHVQRGFPRPQTRLLGGAADVCRLSPIHI